MRRITLSLILTGLIFFSCLSLAEVVEEILVVVNDEVITQSEFDEIMAPLFLQYQATLKGEELAEAMEVARIELLGRLIEDRLLLQEAKKRQIPVEPEELEARLQEIKDRFSNEEEFLGALSHQGLSEDKLKERYHEQLMIKKLVDLEIRAKILVSPTELSSYYHNHQDDFQELEKAKVRMILVKVENDKEIAEAEAEMKKIRRLLEQGEDFADLARRFSQHPSAAEGGELGWVSRGEMREEIDSVIFTLPTGKISDAILIKDDEISGYYIWRIEEKSPAYLIPLSEVHPLIKSIIFQKKLDERLKAWLEKIKEDAYISLH